MAEASSKGRAAQQANLVACSRDTPVTRQEAVVSNGDPLGAGDASTVDSLVTWLEFNIGDGNPWTAWLGDDDAAKDLLEASINRGDWTPLVAWLGANVGRGDGTLLEAHSPEPTSHMGPSGHRVVGTHRILYSGYSGTSVTGCTCCLGYSACSASGCSSRHTAISSDNLVRLWQLIEFQFWYWSWFQTITETV